MVLKILWKRIKEGFKPTEDYDPKYFKHCAECEGVGGFDIGYCSECDGKGVVEKTYTEIHTE